jgi:hypothetical protein
MADTNILHCNETDQTDFNIIREFKDFRASKAIRVPNLEYTMTDNDQVLLESQVARSSQLAQIEDRAEELLSKAKVLHFNVWQGTGIATTEQVAEFYEVPIKTVETVLQRNRKEFDSDGLKVLRGKELGSVTFIMKVTNKARNLTIWNPRATLRLGYLLRDSAIAKAVRTTNLDFIEQVAKPKAAPLKSQSDSR